MMRWLRKLFKYGFWIGLGLAAAAIVYGWSLYRNIRNLAAQDDAHSADVIVILGAAQYNGHPSPVLKARLDHALDLYNQGYARTIMTTGSYGLDPNFSEAHVGTEYLKQQGVEPGSIITEQGSGTTRDSIRAAVAVMQANRWKSVLVVSDGFHMYRVKRMLNDAGVIAYTSPDPDSPIENDATQRYWHSLREILLVFAYRVFNF
jgi:uncharacterized SAM-binding protein YcdF (DUF218 family)